jgi:hypothetical protein
MGTAQSSSRPLPQELYDLIISHVDDRPTLRACALTCRAWTFASQTRLFSRTIRIHKDRKVVQRLAAALRVSPRLPSYLTDVSINALFVHGLAGLHLPTLRVLHLACQWKTIMHDLPTLRADLASFPHLADLRISKVNFTDDSFVYFVRSLPPILCLKLSDYYWQNHDEQAVPPLTGNVVPPCISDLSLDAGSATCAGRILIQLMEEGHLRLELERLRLVMFFSDSAIPVVNTLLRISKPLRTFSYRIGPYSVGIREFCP